MQTCTNFPIWHYLALQEALQSLHAVHLIMKNEGQGPASVTKHALSLVTAAATLQV